MLIKTFPECHLIKSHQLTWSWVLRRSMGAVTVRDTASARPAERANVLHIPKPDASSGNSIGKARLSPTSKTYKRTFRRITFLILLTVDCIGVRCTPTSVHVHVQGFKHLIVRCTRENVLKDSIKIKCMLKSANKRGAKFPLKTVLQKTGTGEGQRFLYHLSSKVTWERHLTRLCFHEDTSSPKLSTGLMMTWCRNSSQSTVIELSLSILLLAKTAGFHHFVSSQNKVYVVFCLKHDHRTTLG